MRTGKRWKGLLWYERGILRAGRISEGAGSLVSLYEKSWEGSTRESHSGENVAW